MATWTLEDGRVAPMQLLGAPIPVEEEFCRLGIGIQIRLERGAPKRQMERGASVPSHMPQLSRFHRRSTEAGSLALAITLHGVELANTCVIDGAVGDTNSEGHLGAHEAGEGQGGSVSSLIGVP